MKLQLAPSFLSILALGILLTAPSQALAQGIDENASVGIYLTDPQSRPCNQDPVACNDESIQLGGEAHLPYFAYICVFNSDPSQGILGAEFGIDFQGGSSGLEVFEWSQCGTLEFPSANWPDAGSGTIVTFEECQKYQPSFDAGVTAILGYMYVTAYGDDFLKIIERPVPDPAVKVANCERAETRLDSDQFGWVAFSEDGSQVGELPCTLPVIEEATWGQVKQDAATEN
ncbi:MAG: hypothetical protein HKN21_08930 [Candidatus Eisenbacteria bacterium]|uniref:Uncharacterized protein n=1 Tax=Eiseniibacteriota bacterium TaxID=2212470 RepID=A0A7Y2E9Q5_UNCEI|nr:hypothetical protein [Candidatus Eisenbacteria bacterium]